MIKMMNEQVKKPKRVLIFSLTYYPKMVGGAEVAIKEITDRIKEQDVIFDMVTLRFDKNLPKKERIGNVNIYRVGFTKNNPSPTDLLKFPMYLNKVLYPIFAVFLTRKLDKKNKYNGFWVMMSYAGFPVVLYRTLFRKVPYLLTLQEGDDLNKVNNRLRIKIFNLLFKKIFRQAKITQPISSYLASWAKKMGAKDIEIIPNGVSKIENQVSFNKKTSKEFFGIDFNGKIIISTSRLVYKNAIDVLIKALKFLPQDYFLVVAGRGPEKNYLLELAKKEKVFERVRFLDYVENDRIYEFLNVGDVFARISRTEGQGISFLEAMNARLPVVASLAGGIVDFVKDGETGLIAEIDNPLDVAEKIKKLIDNQDLREKIISQAKKMVSEKYDWEILSKQVEKLFFNF